MEIDSRTFLVTGAGSGLGAATARMLAAAGANVVVADINAESGASVAVEIGSRARFVHVDPSDEVNVAAAVYAAVETFGGLHGAVSCAATIISEKTLSRSGPHPLGSFTRTLQLNLVGTFNVMRLAAAAIARGEPDANGERGVIISTASIAAYEGQIGQAALAASVGGVISMTLPVARDLGWYGIRVLTLAVGMFDVPTLRLIPEPLLQDLERQTAFPPRAGRPEEYAAMVRHAIENPMLNGEVIRLDGGLRLPLR